MKRYRNLYDKVISLDNLRLADSKARKGKARQRSVKIFDRDREGNLHQKLIRKSIKQNFCRAVARLKKQNATPETIRRKTASWYGWAKHSNSNHLLQKLFYYDKDILQPAAAGV